MAQKDHDDNWKSLRSISGGGKYGTTHVYRDKTKDELKIEQQFNKLRLIILLVIIGSIFVTIIATINI